MRPQSSSPVVEIPNFIPQRTQAPPALAELGALGTLVVFYLASDIYSDDSYDVVNIAGPLCFCAILAFGIWQQIQLGIEMIWTALFAFRCSTLVYFGFGSLVPLFVNAESRAYIESFYAFSDSELARLNLLSASCVLIVLMSSRFAQFFMADTLTVVPKQNTSRITSTRRIKNYGLVFFAVGASIKYLIVFPYSMGWVTVSLPGAIGSLSFMSLCGIYLLTIWSLRTRLGLFLLVCTMVMTEIVMGLLLLSKTEALLPMLVFLMALVIHKPNFKTMMFAIFVTALTFSVMQPLISYAREQFWQRTGGSGQMDLSERFEILSSYFFAPLATRTDEIQGSYVRISYVNIATYAMAMYDHGLPGNSFDDMLIILIPRLFWPDKPTFIAGQQFSTMASGYESNNSVWPGLFAEAYWNFGWLGLPLVMTPFGILLSLLSNYSLSMLRREEWIFLPILFINLRIGASVDNQFTTAVFGTLALAVLLHFGTRVAVSISSYAVRRR